MLSLGLPYNSQSTSGYDPQPVQAPMSALSAVAADELYELERAEAVRRAEFGVWNAPPPPRTDFFATCAPTQTPSCAHEECLKSYQQTLSATTPSTSPVLGPFRGLSLLNSSHSHNATGSGGFGHHTYSSFHHNHHSSQPYPSRYTTPTGSRAPSRVGSPVLDKRFETPTEKMGPPPPPFSSGAGGLLTPSSSSSSMAYSYPFPPAQPRRSSYSTTSTNGGFVMTAPPSPVASRPASPNLAHSLRVAFGMTPINPSQTNYWGEDYGRTQQQQQQGAYTIAGSTLPPLVIPERR